MALQGRARRATLPALRKKFPCAPRGLVRQRMGREVRPPICLRASSGAYPLLARRPASGRSRAAREISGPQYPKSQRRESRLRRRIRRAAATKPSVRPAAAAIGRAIGKGRVAFTRSRAAAGGHLSRSVPPGGPRRAPRQDRTMMHRSWSRVKRMRSPQFGNTDEPPRRQGRHGRGRGHVGSGNAKPPCGSLRFPPHLPENLRPILAFSASWRLISPDQGGGPALARSRGRLLE